VRVACIKSCQCAGCPWWCPVQGGRRLPAACQSLQICALRFCLSQPCSMVTREACSRALEAPGETVPGLQQRVWRLCLGFRHSFGACPHTDITIPALLHCLPRACATRNPVSEECEIRVKDWSCQSTSFVKSLKPDLHCWRGDVASIFRGLGVQCTCAMSRCQLQKNPHPAR